MIQLFYSQVFIQEAWKRMSILKWVDILNENICPLIHKCSYSFICSSQKLRRPQCPSKGEWINYGTACLKHYSATKRNKLGTCSNVNKPLSPRPQIIYTVCIFHVYRIPIAINKSIVSESKSVGVWRLGEYGGGKEGGASNGAVRNFWYWWMCSLVLTVLMIPQVFMYIKTNQNLHFNRCSSYFNYTSITLFKKIQGTKKKNEVYLIYYSFHWYSKRNLLHVSSINLSSGKDFQKDCFNMKLYLVTYSNMIMMT